MTQESLHDRIGQLADAVLADWRWTRDDLNVSVLGMLLYGFALAAGRATGLAVADIDAVMLRCMMERVGAAEKWSRGLVASAHASAQNKAHHPGEHALIEAGRTYLGAGGRGGQLNSVFANMAKVRQEAGLPEPMVIVFLNPLVVLLSAREEQKGAPLTEAEVLEVRDTAACVRMPLSRAERFYASLDAQVSIPRLNPERIWEQWQALRD